MRINIYAEELTTEVQLQIKEVEDDKFGYRIFYGLRFFLKSPQELHHSVEDDDRSAVTLWVKWTNKDGTNCGDIKTLLENLTDLLGQIPDSSGLVDISN